MNVEIFEVNLRRMSQLTQAQNEQGKNQIPPVSTGSQDVGLSALSGHMAAMRRVNRGWGRRRWGKGWNRWGYGTISQHTPSKREHDERNRINSKHNEKCPSLPSIHTWSKDTNYSHIHEILQYFIHNVCNLQSMQIHHMHWDTEKIYERSHNLF